MELDIAWQEWLVAEGAKQAAVRVAAAGKRLVLTRALEQQLSAQQQQQQQQLTSHAVAAGARTRLDDIASTTAIADAHRQTLDAEGEIDTQRLALHRLLDLPPTQSVPVQVAQRPTAIVWPARMADDFQQQRLDLLALKRGYDSQEASLRVAVQRQFPRFAIDFARTTDTSEVGTLALGVTIDLPLFDRNQGVIASETVLAAVFALTPFAMGWGQGAAMQQSLAIAIISGLLVQVVLVLVVLPALLCWWGADRRWWTMLAGGTHPGAVETQGI